MTRQELFEAGKRAADRLYGAEARPYDRALGGVFMMLTGEEPTTRDVMDVARRWHNPLAGVSDEVDAEAVVFQMAHVLDWAVKDVRDSYEMDRGLEPSAWLVSGRLERIHSPEHVERLAAGMIDAEIKRKFPGVRRGSRRYKELADSVHAKAVAIAKGDAMREADKAVASVRAEAGRYERENVQAALGRTQWIEALARDVDTLSPGSPTVSLAVQFIEGVERRADEGMGYYEDAIAEAERRRTELASA